MKRPTVDYIYLSVMITVTALAVARFRKVTLPLRLLIVLILYWFVAEVIEYVTAEYSVRNLWLLHINNAVEMILFVCIYHQWRTGRRNGLLLIGSLVLFLIIWIVGKFTFEPLQGADDVTWAVSRVIQLYFGVSVLLRTLSDEKDIPWPNNPKFLISAAFVVYSAGTFLLFSLFTPLLGTNRELLIAFYHINWILMIFAVPSLCACSLCQTYGNEAIGGSVDSLPSRANLPSGFRDHENSSICRFLWIETSDNTNSSNLANAKISIMPPLYYATMIVEAVASVVGWLRYKRLNVPLRLVILLLTEWFICGIIEHILGSHHIHNLWITQLNNVFEMSIFTSIFFMWRVSRRNGRVVVGSFLLFLVVWIVAKFTFEPITEPDDVTWALSRFIQLTVGVVFLVHATSLGQTTLWLNDARFLVTSGFLVYAAGTFFLFSLYTPLLGTSTELLKSLYSINWIFLIISHLLFARAAFCKQ